MYPKPTFHPMAILGLMIFLLGMVSCCMLPMDWSNYEDFRNSSQTFGYIIDKDKSSHYRGGDDYEITYRYEVLSDAGILENYEGKSSIDQQTYESLAINARVEIVYVTYRPSSSVLATQIPTKQYLKEKLIFTLIILPIGIFLMVRFNGLYLSGRLIGHTLPLHPDFGKPLQRKKSPYDTEKNKKKRVWHVNPPKDDSYFS